MNQFCYQTQEGSVKGFFNIYQGKDGLIYLQMGNTRITKLAKHQIDDLYIDVYSLKDFDYDDYCKAYQITAPVS